MMENLPKRPLGQICEIVNGGTPKTDFGEYWGGEHRWITPAEMGKRTTPYICETARTLTKLGLANSSARILPPHSVILSSRAPIGHLAINTEPMAFNQGCKGLIPNESIDYKYLYYYLGSIVELLNALGTGATFKELSGGKLKEVPIPLVEIPEQQRIVGILDEMFDGIATARANAEQNLRNARALFKSYLQSVFTHTNEGWVAKTLEQVAHENCSLSYGIVQPGDEYLNGLPIVRPTDLTGKMIRLVDLKRIKPELAAGYKRTTLFGGDLLLCVRGSTGVISIAADELAGANVTRGIVPIRFNDALITQSFGFYLLSSDQVQNQIRGKTYGTALMQINIRDLRNIKLLVPPLDQQNSITRKLDFLTEESKCLSILYQRKLKTLEDLKKSLLHQAFSGQL